MKIVQLLFSFKGRLHRSTYWLGITIGSFFLLPAMFIVAYDAYKWLAVEMQKNQDADPLMATAKLFDYDIFHSANVILAAPFFIASMWSLLAVTAKRFHDMNVTGWLCVIWLPLTFMPGFGVFLLSLAAPIAIGCIRGTVGANKYGPDTLPAE